MPKNYLDKVEIVEPPIGELSKNKSSFRHTCFTSCVTIILFFIIMVASLRLFIGTGPKEIKSPPPGFPNDIPLYAKDNIERINFIPGNYKKRSLEIAALFPKIILSPVLLRLNQATPSSGAPGLWDLVAAPVSDDRDTVIVEWRNLDAEPTFVIAHYKKELSKKGYVVENEPTLDATSKKLTFIKPQTLVSGTLTAFGDEEKKPGTDYAILSISYDKDRLTATTR